jgi:hypothetical protein
MKITRKQLRQIIQEEVGLAPDAMARVKSAIIRVLKDEGGAAGLDPIVQAVEGAAGEDVNIDVAKFIADEMSDRVSQHSDGDYVEKTGISENTAQKKITKKQLRQIVKETLLLEKNENPSWNLYKYTGDVWQNLKTTVPDTGGERSELAASIRDVYTSISSAVMAFAAAYAVDNSVVNTANVNRNIDRAISELEKIRSIAAGKPEEIARFTGDEAFDVANTAVATSTRIEDIQVDKPSRVQAAADKPRSTTLWKYYDDRNQELPSKAERADLAKSVGLSQRVQDAIRTKGESWANTALLKRLLQIEDELAQDD